MDRFKRLSFFEDYFDYVDGISESPLIYHRWAILTCLSALINRKVYLPFGHKNLYPNMFTILVGSAAGRKSTAINIANDLLMQTGYRRILSERLYRDSLLENLGGKIDFIQEGEAESIDSFLEIEVGSSEYSDAFIKAPELESTIGIKNLDLISLLTDLWDCPDGPIKLPKSSRFEAPRNIFLSILGGTTLNTFQRIFPPDIISQGTLSRMMLIYSNVKREKITWPRTPTEKETAGMVDWLRKIKSLQGEMKVSSESREIIDKIYRKQNHEIDDYRFEHYNERRLDHLLSLCILCACADLSMTINREHVIYANSVLKFAERYMPNALGEFGDDETSKIAYRVLMFLRKAPEGKMGKVALMNKLKTDLSNPERIIDAIHMLQQAGKIEIETSPNYQTSFLKAVSVDRISNNDYLDMSLLREYEENKHVEIDEFSDEEEDYENYEDPDQILSEMREMLQEDAEEQGFKQTEDENVVRFKI